jgi:hypothetical protein
MAARPEPLPRLRHARDWQSLAYLIALPSIVTWQWKHGFSALLYAMALFLTVGVGVIHHNHAHVRMWHGRRVNRVTDCWLTLLQGHPTFVFWPTHLANHHRHHHGPLDAARTYRFSGGDTNHLAGYLLHPLQAVTVLYPLVGAWLERVRLRWPGVWRYCMAQYVVCLLSWSVLLALDWQKALLFVIAPQLHGLHWLLGANYLQHAHADGGPDRRSRSFDYARNFEGLVNPLLFNIGLHTAHHEHGRAHWSELTRLHRQRYRTRAHPGLNEAGLLPYAARVFLLGQIAARFRSRSLMADPPTQS